MKLAIQAFGSVVIAMIFVPLCIMMWQYSPNWLTHITTLGLTIWSALLIASPFAYLRD